jgi:hypothetical protein
MTCATRSTPTPPASLGLIDAGAGDDALPVRLVA